MKWHKPLYVGEKAQKKKRKIIRKIKANRPQMNAYIISIATNDANLLDLYPASVLLHNTFLQKQLHIVGIGADKQDALEVVKRLAEETYTATGGYNIRDYLTKQNLRM